VPGTVGGAVWANAGAHGSDVKAVLESADVLLADGSEVRLPVEELRLAYRESRFKAPEQAVEVPGDTSEASGASDASPASDASAAGPAEIVMAARFALEAATPEVIKERLDDIRRWRQAHQPLGIPSAGSTFRNPPEGPSAGELIERAGLKGRQVGGATVSPKHANFVVNDRKGTAADVRRLVDQVRATILETQGIELVPEIVFLGDWEGWPWPEAEQGSAAS
jgi:UDP-N-acetylmuramate dehydrogenase